MRQKVDHLSPFKINEQFKLIENIYNDGILRSIKADNRLLTDEYSTKFQSVVNKVFEKLNETLETYGPTLFFKEKVQELLNAISVISYTLANRFRNTFREKYDLDPTVIPNDLVIDILEEQRIQLEELWDVFYKSVKEFQNNLERNDFDDADNSFVYSVPRYILPEQIVKSIYDEFDGKLWQAVTYREFLSCFDLNVNSLVQLKFRPQNTFVYLLSRVNKNIGGIDVDKEIAFNKFGIKDYTKHRSTVLNQPPESRLKVYSRIVQLLSATSRH